MSKLAGAIETRTKRVAGWLWVRDGLRRVLADRWLWVGLVGLGVVCAVFECTDWDMQLQDRIFVGGHWLVDAKAFWPRVLCYSGPKAALWVLGLGLAVLGCAPASRAAWVGLGQVARCRLWVAAGTLAIAPALVATGKATTNVFTPMDLQRYGGYAPYAKTFARHAPGERPKRRGHGFPAGHASGGFALFGCASMYNSRRWRYAVTAVALGLGGWMGTYQMLKGAHFLSHTLVSALLCWIVYRLVLRAAGEIRESAGQATPVPVRLQRSSPTVFRKVIGQ